jgi:predicted XRE-type DNA-binding protein
MSVADDVTHSTGNVFADLGFEAPEVELLKAKLAHQISKIVSARGWTEGQAAAALAIDQATVSSIARGRFGDFSADQLLRLLTQLGYDVCIDITPNLALDRRAQITVLAQIESGNSGPNLPGVGASSRKARTSRSAKRMANDAETAT